MKMHYMDSSYSVASRWP